VILHEDWLQEPTLDATPAAWICGDWHLKTFGTDKGDNRLV
jgi:uncharacterized protein (DUF2252 family)